MYIRSASRQKLGEDVFTVFSVFPRKKGSIRLCCVCPVRVSALMREIRIRLPKVITLEVGIHGIPVTMQQSVYDALAGGALSNYWTFGRDSRDASYYNRVVVGALRAVDFICSLPQYNGKALGVTGSSQGGALSVITAALDSRVTFLAAVHPALCDHEAFFKKRACGWPHYFYYYGAPDEKQLETVRYYDTANFARLLNVPGWFSWGYNDEVCPPTSMYAAYNVIASPKELHPYLETGHYWYQEQWDEWLDWIRRQLDVPM